MRLLALLFALLMPLVAWMSQQQMFGPDNGTISDQYPTLVVAAGYAFSIWGLIFLGDVVFGLWQLRKHEPGTVVARIRPAAALGFALTAAWMPIFSMQLFWMSLLVIWASLACLVFCAITLSRDPSPASGKWWLASLPLSLHAGWLSLAAFLNLAQVIVAYQWLPTDAMLTWSLVLLALAAVLLLILNARMRGSIGYMLAALWGLVAVYVKQSGWSLPGSDITAVAALVVAGALTLQGVALLVRHRNAYSSTR